MYLIIQKPGGTPIIILCIIQHIYVKCRFGNRYTIIVQ